MKAHARPNLVNLDVLALSLLCCLLASVVGVLVLSAHPHEQGDAPPPDMPAPELQCKLAVLHDQVRALDRSRQDLVDKENYAVLRGENTLLDARLKKLAQDAKGDEDAKAALQRQIDDAKEDLARYQRKKQALDAQLAARPDIVKRMVGNYTGPFILLECSGDGATVYPGKSHLQSNASGDALQPLIDRIKQAGYVVMLARPSAWSGGSFERLRTALYAALDEAYMDKPVRRSAIPLDSSASITPYLPPGQ